METKVDDVTLRYEVRGEGDPVLFLHGFPLSGAMWDPVVDRLADGWRCIVPDLRGMGGSGAGPVDGIADYADDAARVLDALGETRPVVVVGMSMGGYVAFAFCRAYPERVRALALVDTREEADTEETARGRRETAEKALKEGSAAIADDMVGKLFAAGAPEDLKARWRNVIASTPPEGVAAALRAMAERPDSTGTLRALDRPVLVVVGGEDAVTPVRDARRMADTAGQATLEVVPGAGHMAVVEAPEPVASSLRRFLGGLPAAAQGGR